MREIHHGHLVFNLYHNVELRVKGTPEGWNNIGRVAEPSLGESGGIYTAENVEKNRVDWIMHDRQEEYIYDAKFFLHDGNGGIYQPKFEEDDPLIYALYKEGLGVQYQGQFLKNCAELNKSELQRARSLLSFWKERSSTNPENNDIKNIVNFLDKIIERYYIWYHENSLAVPSEENVTSVKLNTGKSPWPNMKFWKKKFAVLVNQHYDINKAEYGVNKKRECARDLFPRFEFPDKNWTIEQLIGILDKY
jgi:hypothetical protein